MQTLILFGAGQMGPAAWRLIRQERYAVLAFADNSPGLWGSVCCGLPVLPPREALALKPDGILITVMGAQRTDALTAQLRELGYAGPITALKDCADALDIRAAVLDLLSERIQKLPGALAELGVYQGDFSARMNALFPERTLYLFDTFTGFDARDLESERRNRYSRAAAGDFGDTSVELVLAKLQTPRNAVICKGYFPDTAEGIDEQFAFVSLDADLCEPTRAGLEWFCPRMVSGGVLLLHDYYNQRFSGVRAAVDDYEQTHGPLLLLPVGDLHGSVMVIHP